MARLPSRLLFAAAVGALAARRRLRAPYDLSGKSVLITGGSRGLGLALARECLDGGANVTLLARTAADLEGARAWLAAPGRVHTIAADVTDAADIARAVDDTARHYGGLDVLIHSAGLIQSGPLENMTEADFREVMEVNAFAPLRLTLAARPLLRARRGRVLIVASVGGRVAIPHLAPYSVSKFAATGLGQALRAELAHDGVTVATALPGLMRTGSARRAQIKGQHEKEYALFATLDNLPVLSLDAREAARRIVAALRRGDAEAVIGGPALLLRAAQALAPELLADALALGARLLPGPGTSHAAVPGAQAETPLTRRNAIKRQAEADWNQLGDARIREEPAAPDPPGPLG